MGSPQRGEQPESKAKVLLVDDHPVMRQGLARLIDPQPDLTVCGEVGDAAAALKAIAATKPDIAVVDISLDRDMGGIELIKDIKVRYPDLPVLVLSMHDESVFADRAIRAGARGYVMKEEATKTVLDAIRCLLDGEIYLSDRMARKMLTGIARGRSDEGKFPVERLTNRELEVLQLTGQGLGTSQIAKKLHISVKTVETHRAHVKEKLKLDNSAQLLQYAIQWVQSQGVG